MTGSSNAELVSPETLGWLHRLVWLACVCVYLVVLVSGILGGTPDLLAMLRAAGLTLATAALGKLAIALLARAPQPAAAPLANEDRTLGSRLDLVSSPNVVAPQVEPEAL
jgi:hypothetical protein